MKDLSRGARIRAARADLVVADSLKDYDDELSRQLTERVVTANLVVRDLGYNRILPRLVISGTVYSLCLTRTVALRFSVVGG